MKDEFKKLNTYCALGEDGNIVDRIESKYEIGIQEVQ